MAKQTINIGTNQDDGTGDLLRVAFNKVNDNFTEIYNELGGTNLSSLSFNSNVISTDTTNQDIVLSPSGAGEVDISADTLIRGALVVTGQSRSNTLQVDSNAQINGALNVTGAATFGSITIGSTIASDLNVSGAVTVGGLFTANGSVDLGDTTADTITYVGRVDSSIVPSVTQNNDLGSATLKWRDLYLRDVDARNGTFSGNVDVTGNITLGGNITIGDSDADIINIEADIGGNLIPNTDSTYSVGTDAKRYLNVFGDYVHATDLRTTDLSVSGSTITTLTTNTDLTLDAQGTGVVRATKLEVADVSSGQVITATTDGRLQSESGLTWDGTTLGATQATVGSVTLITNTISTSGGNIVINPTGNVDFNSNLLINVSDPSGTQDAATKGYVDTQITANAYSLTIVDDTSTSHVIENNEILGIIGGADISSIISSDTLTIANTSTLDTVVSRGASTTTAVSFNGGISSTTISATSTITTTNTITGNRVETSGIRLEDNNILSTNTNDDINLLPAGTGKVVVAGDTTINGGFTVGASQTISMGSNKITNVTDPTSAQDSATKNYVDTTTTANPIYVAVAGDAMTGALAMGANSITGLADPVADQDAATKVFVDTSIANSYFVLTDDTSTATSINNSELLSIVGSGLVSTAINSNDEMTITVATQTLDIVTTAGATTSNSVTVGGLTTTGSINTDGITIADNNITTSRTNDDLILRPAGTGRVVVDADRLHIETEYTPASAVGSAGDQKGDIAVDSNYIYYCTANYDGATSVWKRVAIATW